MIWTDESGHKRTRLFTAQDAAQAWADSVPARTRGMYTQPLTQADILASREVDAGGCWIWTGPTHKTQRYGEIYSPGTGTQFAHRVSYELFVGPIPDGLELDHLCRVRPCVNPAHLEPVTHLENVMRSPIAIGALNAAKTHCPHGHEYTPENTRVTVKPNTTMRSCRSCERRRTAASHTEPLDLTQRHLEVVTA